MPFCTINYLHFLLEQYHYILEFNETDLPKSQGTMTSRLVVLIII